MKILTNKKYENLIEGYNETIAVIVSENKIKQSKIECLEKINFDIDGENQKMQQVIGNLNETFKKIDETQNMLIKKTEEIVAVFEHYNEDLKKLIKVKDTKEKEIDALKKNVREAYSEITEEQVQNTIVEEVKSKKKLVKKAASEKIVEESKEKKSTKKAKSNTPDNHVKIIVDDLTKDVESKKNEVLFDKCPKIITTKDTKKKTVKGRKPNVSR